MADIVLKESNQTFADMVKAHREQGLLSLDLLGRSTVDFNSMAAAITATSPMDLRASMYPFTSWWSVYTTKIKAYARFHESIAVTLDRLPKELDQIDYNDSLLIAGMFDGLIYSFGGAGYSGGSGNAGGSNTTGGSGNNGGDGGDGKINLGRNSLYIAEELEKTSEGRRALKIQQDYHVTVSYGTPGGGTYYDPDSNTVYIDQSSQDSTNVLIVRGMSHAEAYQNGSSPNTAENRTKLGRDEYVQGMLNEEANAMVAGISQFKQSSKGQMDPIALTIYNNAYNKAYTSVLNNAPDAGKVPWLQNPPSPQNRNGSDFNAFDRARQAGERAGRFAIFDALKDGGLLTHDGEKYSNLYGNAWDYYNLHQGIPAGVTLPPSTD